MFSTRLLSSVAIDNMNNTFYCSVKSTYVAFLIVTLQELQIESKIGKCKSHIEYSADVKQGDNLAPTLFIIVMYFLVERLEQKWNEKHILIPSFYHNSNLSNKSEKLIRHETSCNKNGNSASYKSQRPFTKDEFFLLLYVDDGALIFTNRSDAILRSKIAFTQMKRMGLNMHLGIGDKKSKTEAMFFLK